MPLTENDLSGAYAGNVLSGSGEKIGSVGQIYVDDQTGEPTFVTANTGLFGMSQSFVPLRGARVENGNVVVDFDKTTVKDAPRIDDDGSLTPAEEDRLYAYYGMGSANVDLADYGTADQAPQPGFSRADQNDAGAAESRLAEGTGEAGPSGPVGPAEVNPAAAAGSPTGEHRNGGQGDAVSPHGGRLRKLVATDHQRGADEVMHVEGQRQPGERSTH